MDKMTERAYKRTCFQGRGSVARWLDRAFFALLGGVCLYLLCPLLWLSCLLSLALLTFFLVWDRRRWARYRDRLWQDAVQALRREDWLRNRAEDIRQAGGIILYPTPDQDALTGFCLRLGAGAAFHCFGETDEALAAQAQALGGTIVFHPWGQGRLPSREEVEARLRRNAPMRERKLWQMLLHLSYDRYLLTGCVLLMLSILLRRALYWRLLGSLCLMIGAIRRAFRMTATT